MAIEDLLGLVYTEKEADQENKPGTLHPGQQTRTKGISSAFPFPISSQVGKLSKNHEHSGPAHVLRALPQRMEELFYTCKQFFLS